MNYHKQVEHSRKLMAAASVALRECVGTGKDYNREKFAEYQRLSAMANRSVRSAEAKSKRADRRAALLKKITASIRMIAGFLRGGQEHAIRRTVKSDDCSVNVYFLLKGRDAKMDRAELREWIEERNTSPYDCSGRLVTCWIDFFRTPLGLLVRHRMTLDI